MSCVGPRFPCEAPESLATRWGSRKAEYAESKARRRRVTRGGAQMKPFEGIELISDKQT